MRQMAAIARGVASGVRWSVAIAKKLLGCVLDEGSRSRGLSWAPHTGPGGRLGILKREPSG